MRFYNQQHQYYCGIDLHTKSLYVCVLNQSGDIILHQNMAVDSETLLQALIPFMPDVVIAVECIFPAMAGLDC